MGVSSNLEPVFLPKKHSKDYFLVTPAMETPTRQERVQEQEQEDHGLSALISLDLKIKVPSYKDDDNDQGLNTPTSPKHRIPAIRSCPSAPRKPKSQPSKKRKDQFSLDLSPEIESFFSSQFNADGFEHKKMKIFTD